MPERNPARHATGLLPPSRVAVNGNSRYAAAASSQRQRAGGATRPRRGRGIRPTPRAARSSDAVPPHAIRVIRGQRLILDFDLADLYGVVTGRLNEQVRRNRDRFPADFMFQLTAAEAMALRSQTAMSKPGRGGRRHPPLAFTEHGAISAAPVSRRSGPITWRARPAPRGAPAPGPRHARGPSSGGRACAGSRRSCGGGWPPR